MKGRNEKWKEEQGEIKWKRKQTAEEICESRNVR